MSREDHHAFIDFFCDDLRAAMKEKSDANWYKVSLADETDARIAFGREEEHLEKKKEFYSAKRFGTDEWLVMLEIADEAMYDMEDYRRIGGFDGRKEG